MQFTWTTEKQEKEVRHHHGSPFDTRDADRYNASLEKKKAIKRKADEDEKARMMALIDIANQKHDPTGYRRKRKAI